MPLYLIGIHIWIFFIFLNFIFYQERADIGKFLFVCLFVCLFDVTGRSNRKANKCEWCVHVCVVSMCTQVTALQDLAL